MTAAIIQVNVPSMLTKKAVMVQRYGLYHIQKGKIGSCCYSFIHIFYTRNPIPVAAPRVKGAVVAGFPHGVENVAMLNEMPAPAAVPAIMKKPEKSFCGEKSRCILPNPRIFT